MTVRASTTTPRPRRHRALVSSALGIGLMLPLLAACGGESSAASETRIGTTLDEIAALAKEESTVHLIAYPEDWANYGKSFDAFTAKYGVDVDVTNPDGSSAEELEAVRTFAGTEKLPDVLDIGSSFTQVGIDEGLFDPYKPSVWDEIPDNLKDPDGQWVSAYYGVLEIGVNADVVDVPKKLTDLRDPQYKGKITLGGDPREGAAQFGMVYAAALANGGSLDDIQPGIDFWAELAADGYLVNTSGATAAMTTGQAAVTLDWNYNFFGARDELEKSGVNLKTVVPSDAVFGNFYAQPIPQGAPEPNAARLWVEWLLSDEGAAIYAESGAVPARYQAIADSLPAEAAAGLPPADILAKVAFPTQAQRDAATKLVTAQWGERVATS